MEVKTQNMDIYICGKCDGHFKDKKGAENCCEHKYKQYKCDYCGANSRQHGWTICEECYQAKQTVNPKSKFYNLGDEYLKQDFQYCVEDTFHPDPEDFLEDDEPPTYCDIAKFLPSKIDVSWLYECMTDDWGEYADSFELSPEFIEAVEKENKRFINDRVGLYWGTFKEYVILDQDQHKRNLERAQKYNLSEKK